MATKNEQNSAQDWTKLSNEQRSEFEHAEWLRTYMNKTANPNILTHTDPLGNVYQIVRNPDHTWSLVTPSGDTFPFRLRKECVHAIARTTAQILYELGHEVGKYVKPIELTKPTE